MEDIEACLPPANPRDASSSYGRQGSSWISVDAATRDSQIIEVDKFSMMRRCHLPPRDLRLLDPSFCYPSTILARGKAMVVNLELIRCIITPDEVVLPNFGDSHVSQYVVELLRGLKDDYLPFEVKALQVALQTTCNILNAQVEELENEARPLLDELKLKSKISTSNFKRVRSKLVALTHRVEKVRDGIEQYLVSSPPGSPENLTDELLVKYFSVIVSTLNKLTSLKEGIDDAERFINFKLNNVRARLIQFRLLGTAYLVWLSGLWSRHLLCSSCMVGFEDNVRLLYWISWSSKKRKME